jgi:deoxyadenosine/deoxycytidine kinase
VLDDMHYVAIEGPIGVGKTSLATRLAERLGARLVLEPSDTNPFLEKFYTDMAKYALATQLTFLVSRYQQQTTILQGELFSAKVVSDYILARDKIFATMTLSDEEYKLYNQLYLVMSAHAARPDLLVLLKADVDTLMGRIEKRGVRYEASLSREYITRLNESYEEFFRLYADSPLLMVDTDGLEYPEDELDLDALVVEMDATRHGRRLYIPSRE